MDTVIVSSGFFKGLFSLVIALASKRRSRVSSLALLVDRKFREIDNTHLLFISLLTELSETAQSSAKHLDGTDDIAGVHAELYSFLKGLKVRRAERREARLSEYAEAAVYARNEFRENGIINTLPPSIVTRIQIFMKSWSEYFMLEREYQHALSHVIILADGACFSVEEIIRNKSDQTAINGAKFLLDKLHSEAELALQVSRRRWSNVSRTYHEFTLALREGGYDVKVVDAPPFETAGAKSLKRPAASKKAAVKQTVSGTRARNPKRTG